MTMPIFPITRRAFALGAVSLNACAKSDAPVTTILVGGTPGSATDLLARLFARHCSRLFGADSVVENVPHHTGGAIAQRLSEKAGAGDTLGFLQNGLLYTALLTKRELPWDLTRLGWIGSFNADHRVLMSSGSSQLNRFEDLLSREKPAILVTGAVGASGYYEARILQHLTQARVRVVPGFDGAMRMLALTSGEGDLALGSLDSLTPVLDLPRSRILLRINDLPFDKASTARGLSSPALAEVSRGSDAPGLLRIVDAHARIGRSVALPPNAPNEVARVWTERFATITRDADFLAAAAKANLLIEPTGGIQLSDEITGLLSSEGTAARAALRRVMECVTDATCS